MILKSWRRQNRVAQIPVRARNRAYVVRLEIKKRVNYQFRRGMRRDSCSHAVGVGRIRTVEWTLRCEQGLGEPKRAKEPTSRDVMRTRRTCRVAEPNFVFTIATTTRTATSHQKRDRPSFDRRSAMNTNRLRNKVKLVMG